MNCKSFYAFVAGALSTISHRNYLNHLQLPPWFVYAAMRMKTTSDRVHKWVMSLKKANANNKYGKEENDKYT